MVYEWITLVSFIGCALAFVCMLYYGLLQLIILRISAFFAFFIFLGIGSYSASVTKEANAAKVAEIEKAEEAQWVANQCPMYQYECGSNSKYGCKVRADKVGPVQIGKIIVEAYPTCKKD